MLDVNGSDVYSVTNSVGYKVLGLIVDNNNKQFQLVQGQVLPNGKYRASSRPKLHDIVEKLLEDGYTEYKGYGSVDLSTIKISQ